MPCATAYAGMGLSARPEWPGRFFNTSFIINPWGEIILKHWKHNHNAFLLPYTSPCDVYDEFVRRYGREALFPVVDTPVGRLGVHWARRRVSLECPARPRRSPWPSRTARSRRPITDGVQRRPARAASTARSASAPDPSFSTSRLTLVLRATARPRDPRGGGQLDP